MRRTSEAPDRTPAVTRVSVIAEAARILREQIRDRLWIDELPGERKLCELLQISRPSLRRALSQLEAEGIIEVSQGKHRKICEPSSSRKPEFEKIRRVIILSPTGSQDMPPVTHFLIENMFTTLQRSGYSLEIETAPWLGHRNPETKLAQLVQSRPCSCWALFSVEKAIQEWFAENQIPALVSGSCYPGVTLPSLDFDYAALVRHAVGKFISKDYSNITLVISNRKRPGSITAIKTFNEFLAQPRCADIQGTVLIASDQHQTFEKQFRTILESSEDRKGFLAGCPRKTLHILTYLLQKRLPIGRDIGVISLDDDFYFDSLSMAPAAYHMSKKRYVKKYCQLLIKLVDSGSLPTTPTRLIPEFREGETI